MEITLSPEIEQALRMEADSSGLAPDQRAAQILSAYAGNTKRAPMTEEQQKVILDRFRLIRETLNLPGPPEGMRFRDWIHLGHKY